MRGIITLQIAIWVIVKAYANFERCPHINFKHCRTNIQEWRDSEGFECPVAGDNGQSACISLPKWCHVSVELQKQNQSCQNSENLQISSCFRSEFTIEFNDTQFQYLLVKAKVSWDVAEAHCQHHGYNLISFSNQLEFDKIVGLQKRAKSSTGSWKKVGGSETIYDPVGQLCWTYWKPPKWSFWDIHFWTGLYRDQKSGQWRYTDGSFVNESILNSFTTHNPRKPNRKLENVLKSTETRVEFKRDEFHGTSPASTFANFPRYTDDNNYANILCKRVKGRTATKWSMKSGFADANSLYGYSCVTGSRMLIGPEYDKSNFFDGRKDCPDGEDENDLKSPSIKVSTNEKSKNLIFFPFKVPASALKKFCSSKKWVLPSIQNYDSDIALLKTLPTKFGESRPVEDFWGQFQNWTDQIPHRVLVGASKWKGYWTDGSRIKFYLTNNERKALSSSHYTYLDINKKKLVPTPTDYRFYAICQEGASSIGSYARLSFLCLIVMTACKFIV